MENKLREYITKVVLLYQEKYRKIFTITKITFTVQDKENNNYEVEIKGCSATINKTTFYSEYTAIKG